ncbi:TetR/AcrR family transcriptional regulator [Methylocapsa sp. S129]|uniref:TetR/AcrR family transcriptional regulator n=1 Tax=Methylocapsa sp. S129 TaxID=1641869 RepID=UPI00131E46C7|nr:TetR/AcrR family transcriptional regulator [Methylocapsa sp. S129]
MKDDKIRRRRGAQLEDAILDAAWDELVEQGYPGLTLEGVAKRADTSRPVLHRRWPSRTALATAALGRHLAQNPIVVPDLGSVREELRLLLRGLSDRARPDMIRLLFDMQKDLADKHSNLAEMRAHLRAQIVDSDVMQPILRRAIDRGEIAAARLTPRIISLPTDLARHEILMTFKPLSDEAIKEIVDEVFLPLVSPRDQRSSS